MEERLRAEEYIGRGATLLGGGNAAASISEFDKALAIDPKNVSAYMYRGNANVGVGQLEQALQDFERVLLIEPNHAEALFNIGNLHLVQDDFQKCVEAYNRAEAAGYRGTEMYWNLAILFRHIGEPLQAIRNLNKAIRNEPLKGSIRLEKASIFLEMQQYGDALATLDELQKVLPDAFEAFNMKAEIYCGLNRYDEALAMIEEAIARFDQDPYLRLIKIRILVDSEQNGAAANEIAHAKQMPDYAAIERGVVIHEMTLFSRAKRLDEAVACLLDYIGKQPGDAPLDQQLWYLMMNLYLAKQDYENMREVAVKLKTVEDDSLFHISGIFYEAEALKGLGRETEANACFTSASKFLRRLTIRNPAFYEAYLYRLLCYKELRQFDKALEIADYIQTLYPELSDAYLFRSAIYDDMGESEKADEQKKIASLKNPSLKMGG